MHQTLLVIHNGRKQSVQTERLRDGAAGNLRTLAVMREMIREDAARDLELRRRVQGLVVECYGHDFNCEVEKLFEYARDRIRFIRDPIDVERIADAATTMADRAGDCGDKTIWLASALGAVGHLSRFVVVDFANDVATNGYDHVYLEVQRPDGTWQPLDPTPENVPPGWEATAAVRKAVDIWPNPGGPSSNLSGFLDQLLPQLINQGIQFGAAAFQQTRASGQQQQQIGAQFDQAAGQVTALFNSIQAQAIITAADLQRAAEAYQQLANVAAQYPTSYVQEQWNSNNYRPAYETRLQQMAQRVQGAQQPGATQTQQPGTQLTTTTGAAQQPVLGFDISGLTSNPLFWAAILFAGFMILKK